METLQLVLLLLAYTVGVVTIFVQLICYTRNIEFKETIYLSASFLILIIAVTIDHFLGAHGQPDLTALFILFGIILTGLTTVLNVYKEREVTINETFKKALIGIAGVLFVTSIVAYFADFIPLMEYVVSIFLVLTIVYAMRLVRTTKPSVRIKHRERIERITALLCMCVLPLTLVIDYLPEHVPFISDNVNSSIKLTLPLLFIFIASGKLVDDIKRLSLFKPGSKQVAEQNLKNYNFTKREMEIVDLLVKGATYNEISEQLFISMPTVKTHVSNIYRKAEVNNKIGLINLVTKS